MAMLDTDVLTELQSLIMPLMEDIQNRRALLELAVGNSKVYQRIDFSGPTDTFTIHVLTTLAKYGEISAGRQALWAFLEVIRSRVGVDHQKHIDEMRPAIEALAGSYHDFGSGAIFARIYNKAGEIPEPTKPDRLFGHSDLLHHLYTLLDENKHVSLTGYGGTGKTALAATLADQRLAEGKGPILWVQARRGSADALFEAIAIRFNQKEDLDRVQSGAQIECIQTMLANAGVKLLVLDDVRNASIVTPMRQVAKGLPMLLTSRRAIGNVNASENLTDLSPDDALELLVHHARNQNISETEYRADPDMRQLCQELGCHAFGVVIAGRWLAENKRKAKALLERIAERRLTPSTIPMPESFVDEGRETVKIVLDETFYALQPAAQEIMKVFGSLFEPQATTELLTICAAHDDRLATEDALDELVSWNFAARVDNFYTMHDMVHAYAEAVCFGDAEPDRQPTVVAVRRYLMDYAQQFDYIELDLPNIVAAAAAANNETLIFIMSILTIGGYPEPGSSSYFDVHGHTLSVLVQLDRAIEAAQQLGEEWNNSLHYLLSKRGNAYLDRSSADRALCAYRKALELSPNTTRKIVLLGVIGKVYGQQKQPDAAHEYFGRAYELAESTGDDRALARVLEYQSHIASLNEDYGAVRDLANKGVDVSMRLGDRVAEGYFRLNLGSAEFDLGVRAALACHQTACTIAQEQDHEALMAFAHNALGIDYHALERYDQAKQHLYQAQELFLKLGFVKYQEEVTALIRRFGYMERK